MPVILLDVDAMANILDKPLTARWMPIQDLKTDHTVYIDFP